MKKTILAKLECLKTLLTSALIAFCLAGFSQEKNASNSQISQRELNGKDAKLISLKAAERISRRDSLDDEYKEPEFQGEEESEEILDKKAIADPKKK